MLSSNIFFTGATGFLGKQLVSKLLLNSLPSQFYLLVRDSANKKAKDRFEQILQEIADEHQCAVSALRHRLHLVIGNLTSNKFGLSDSAFQTLAQKVHQIYHCAASIRLIGDWEPIRKINYFGTQQVLDLAHLAFKNGCFQRLNYISTAYIAGKRTGVIYENELEHKRGFCNNYERAKYETELLVERAKLELPITIFRPSIIVGDAKTGKTNAFNVIYEPMRLAYLGHLKYLPGTNKSMIDVVPVDYVRDAIIALSTMENNTIGKTFHLTVGENQGMSAPKLVASSLQLFKDYSEKLGADWDRILPTFIHPLPLMMVSKLMVNYAKNRQKQLFEKILTYSKYSYYYKTFNNEEADKLLAPLGIEAPKLSSYLDVICKYAINANFGKRR